MDFKAAQRNVLAFASELVIDTPTGPAKLGPLLNDFQREFFQAIGPALERLCGRDVPAACQRFWEERCRGHSKSSDLAIVILWLLIFSRRKVSGVGAAADKDQARLLRDACETFVRMNQILAEVLDVQAYRILNKTTGSVFEILSSDAGSSFGITPDLIIADEVCHWSPSGVDLWHSLLSSAAKRSRCVVACITNAGWTETEWWKLRELVRVDPAWRFSRLPGCVASWISAQHLAEQKRLLPPKVFGRLWENTWVDGAGDAFDASDVDAAITMKAPLTGAESGWQYVAGVDLGLTRDASAVVIVGKHVGSTQRTVRQPKKLTGTLAALVDHEFYDAPQPEVSYQHVGGTGRLRVAAVRVWTPTKNNRVDLEAVEASILELHQRFKLTTLGYDPWQAAYLSQRLSKAGLRCQDVQFGTANLQSMATCVLDAFRERQIAMFDHPELVADLRALRVVERQHGFRLEAGRSAGGTSHADAATALAVGLHVAKNIHTGSVFHGDRKLVYN